MSVEIHEEKFPSNPTIVKKFVQVNDNVLSLTITKLLNYPKTWSQRVPTSSLRRFNIPLRARAPYTPPLPSGPSCNLEGVTNSKFPSVERIGKVPLKKKMFEKHEYFDL
jgi:hypothetical protein